MNKVVLIGRLTADPEISYTSGAKPICVAKYSVAVPRASKKEGEQDTDFIPCRAIGNRGEFAGKYFSRGQRVAVIGELHIDSYTDNSRTKKWSTYILISEQEFADGKSENNQQGQNGGNDNQQNGGNYNQGNPQGYSQSNQGNQNQQGAGYHGQRGNNQGGYKQNGYNQRGNYRGGYSQNNYPNQGQYNNNDFN